MVKKSTKTAKKKTTAKGAEDKISQKKATQETDNNIDNKNEKDITAENEQTEDAATEDKSDSKAEELENKANGFPPVEANAFLSLTSKYMLTRSRSS